MDQQEFETMDLDALFQYGLVRSRKGGAETQFFSVPDNYAQFLNPVLRYHPWDESVLPTLAVVDDQGIAYIVLANYDTAKSKFRKREFDGLQSIVSAIYKEGRTDIFDIPTCCYIDYLCFRVIAAPLQLWLPDENPLIPYLSYDLVKDNPQDLAPWIRSSPEVIDALNHISAHIPGTICPNLFRQFPPSSEALNEDVTSLLISPYRQKLTPYCPIDIFPFPSPLPSDELISLVVDKITNFDCLVTSPIVLRSLLKEYHVAVHDMGVLLVKLQLPVMKQIIVTEMVGRRAKWYIRELLYDHFTSGKPLSHIDVTTALEGQKMEKLMIESASEYFKVPVREIAPFFTHIDPYHIRFAYGGVDIAENRALFPQYNQIRPSFPEVPGFFPTSRSVFPRPPSVEVEKNQSANPIDYLPLKYASQIYRLEMAFAEGNVLEGISILGNLSLTVLKMRQIEPIEDNKEIMRIRALALAMAARDLVPFAISVPTSILQSILECIPVHVIYKNFRQDVFQAEGGESVTLLSLDNQMAKCVFDKSPEIAIPILTTCAERSERYLGARHPVTIASWIRLGQAIKKVLETNPQNYSVQDRQVMIRNAIKWLNKAQKAAELTQPPRFDFILDHLSFVHYLLSIFYLWNGEPGKAVCVSRDGLAILAKQFSTIHPRYLNSAFLHAKLLEKYAASTNDTFIATSTAREAVDVLEDILDALLDLTDVQGVPVEEFYSLDAYLGGIDQFEEEMDTKRKLAITALIVKVNIWLLDAAVASDLLDLVVADYFSGSRGMLDLPRKMAVKDAVIYVINKRTEELQKIHASTLPVLELTTQLPERVVGCLNVALKAKAARMRVSDWFHNFRERTLMTIGDGPDSESSNHRDLLTECFLTFAYIESDDCVFIGPLSAPIVPKTILPDRMTRQGNIYTRWERSATLYTVDHALYPIQGIPMWNGRVPGGEQKFRTINSTT